MNSLGVDGENPYAEPKAPLTGPPGVPAKKTGFTRFQGLTIIVIATLLFLGARWYRQRAIIARVSATLRAAAERAAREKNARKPPVASEPASVR